MSDLSSEIESNAKQAKHVMVDGLQIDQHSIKDLIAADEHLGAIFGSRVPAATQSPA